MYANSYLYFLATQLEIIRVAPESHYDSFYPQQCGGRPRLMPLFRDMILATLPEYISCRIRS